ncbi:MAG TPA: tetratricopeptide repeat protein [Polyangia bacterium]|nr:tetratricopeptide repeat protein [Polyangia bacterium]
MRRAPAVLALMAGAAFAGEPAPPAPPSQSAPSSAPAKSEDVEAQRKACDAKQGKACTALAVRYLGGNGVAADEKRALELFDRACTAGDGAGCSMLGAIFNRGRGAIAPDYARSYKLSKRGCELGDDNGCYDQACDLVAARGIEKSTALAVPAFERLCKKGLAQACGSLGMLYYVGDGVKRDPQRATELLDQACKGGDVRSCPRD